MIFFIYLYGKPALTLNLASQDAVGANVLLFFLVFFFVQNCLDVGRLGTYPIYSQGQIQQQGKRRWLEGIEEVHLVVPEVKAQGEIEA